MGHAGDRSMRELLEGSRDAFSSEVSFGLPGDERFKKSTARMTTYDAPKYGASISVQTEADIQAAVSRTG
jgi:hypothetical protein